jgi:hypothetical protein
MRCALVARVGGAEMANKRRLDSLSKSLEPEPVKRIRLFYKSDDGKTYTGKDGAVYSLAEFDELKAAAAPGDMFLIVVYEDVPSEPVIL